MRETWRQQTIRCGALKDHTRTPKAAFEVDGVELHLPHIYTRAGANWPLPWTEIGICIQHRF